MRITLRSIAVNALIVVASTIICYLALEIAFFRLLLPQMRFDIRPFLPETPGALVQTTKAGYVPHDYVAILGDSYAEGVGDEMLLTRGNEAKLFQATSVIHGRTGRDVITFGHGGAGSAEGYVRLPTRALNGSRCIVFPTIEDPRQIYAYFYEGNDIDENLMFRRKVAATYGRDDTSAIDRYLVEQYGTFASWRCHFYLGDNISRMVEFLREYYVERTDPFATSENNRNTFVIGEAEAPAPSVLGPALADAPKDIDDALVVYDRSLAWLRQRFAQATINVVYLPSPLSTYHLATPRVAYLSYDAAGYHYREAAAGRVGENSDLLCRRTREIAGQHDMGFIDARPALRTAAADRAIHGPIDWLHLNHAGYAVLGEFLTRRLTDAHPMDRCG